jgi:hypothetical protein
MAETLWKWRLILIAPNAANTQQNRDTLAQVFINHASGESLANEKLMFTNAPRLALAASPTVLAGRGVILPVKQSMRDSLQTAIATINTPLSNANKVRWYLIANTNLPGFNEGQLMASNRTTVDGRVGTAFGWSDVLADLSLVEMV